MEPTTTGVAASLAILQAYPLGTLQVLVSHDHRQPSMRGAVGTLIGLRLAEGEWFAMVLTDFDKTDGKTEETWVLVEQLKPFAKPFAALTQQLPDGTIPAAELAKIIFGDTLVPNGELWAGMDWAENLVVVENGAPLYSITKYWVIQCANGLGVGCDAYDYLRSLHFAVGLPETAYIPL